jgi:TraY domain
MARTPQFKVALDESLRAGLEAAAARSGRSLTEEIRARLEGAAGESADPTTEDLRAKISALAEEVELETGTPWHAHQGSFAAFRQGILSALARFKASMPEGSPAFGERPHQSAPGNDPQEIGITLEARVSEASSPQHRRRWRASSEETFRQIRALHERRARGETDNGK